MSSVARLLVVVTTIVGALAACTVSRAQDDRPPVAPVDVCIDDGHGALRSGTAVPSWAGVYDPSLPVQPELLNWMVAGTGGCVSYPGPRARRATCGGVPRPVVTRVLCAQ